MFFAEGERLPLLKSPSCADSFGKSVGNPRENTFVCPSFADNRGMDRRHGSPVPSGKYNPQADVLNRKHKNAPSASLGRKRGEKGGKGRKQGHRVRNVLFGMKGDGAGKGAAYSAKKADGIAMDEGRNTVPPFLF